MLLPADKVQEVKQSRKDKPANDDDLDSEFSEILSELGQEDGNQREIKEMRTKKKRARLQRKMGTPADVPVQDKKKKKGKGKGKGRGKGKGGKNTPGQEAQEAPSRKRKLLDTLIKEAARRLKKRREGGEAKENTPPDQPEPHFAEPGDHLAAESAPSKAQPEPHFEEPEQPEPDLASASASSKAGEASVVVPAEEGGLPAPAKSGAPKVYKSPDEILSPLAPPGCTLGLSYNDHRFISRFAVDSGDALFGTDYSKKTMSASFAAIRSWQEALAMVHEHNWRKWQLLKKDMPLPKGMPEQKPGHIPSKVLEDLKPIIDKLPEVKKYK